MSTRTRQIALSLSLALALPLCGLSVLHAQSASTLQQRMSSAEFQAAGLDKLSPQELQNLDSWLSGHAVKSTKVVDAEGKPVFYADPKARSKIHTRVAGHFGGWAGINQIKLANGQVWSVVGSETPSCLSGENPSVTVKPSLFGNWLMYVAGCNGDAHVQRDR